MKKGGGTSFFLGPYPAFHFFGEPLAIHGDVGLIYAYFSPLNDGLIQKKLYHSIRMWILNVEYCCINLTAH